MDVPTQFNPPPTSPDPGGCAHGQAGLLLIESLMHALVEKKLIDREDFIEIVEGAAEVEAELANAKATASSAVKGSLLIPMAAAFRQELGR